MGEKLFVKVNSDVYREKDGTSSVILWNGPSGQKLRIDKNLVTQAVRGERVEIISEQEEWVHGYLPYQMLEGYIWREHLSERRFHLPGAAERFGINASMQYGRSKVVLAARELVNSVRIPYIYGGTTKKGVDCSFFSKLSVEVGLGIKLPRDSWMQAGYDAKANVILDRGEFPDDETLVDKMEDLQPGDLAFFSEEERIDKIDHVAVMLEDGYLAQSSRYADNPEENSLSIDNIEDSYNDRNSFHEIFMVGRRF